MWQDVVNGLFETLGGFFIMFSCVKLLRQKKVRGVSLVHVTYSTGWGFWNLYYYPFLNQRLSTIGGSIVAIVNILWLVMLIFYIRKEKHEIQRKP